MIITEAINKNGTTLIRTYSNNGYTIKQDGTDVIYDEAIDPADSGRTYTETDTPVENITEDPYAEIGRILLGEEA